MNEQKIRIIKPDDFHCHLRRGEILKSVVGFTAKQFKRAIIMPNTDPPILTAEDASCYRREIIGYCDGGFEPLMAIQINDTTTPTTVVEAKKAGVVAGKVYPQGVTTNSQNGVTEFKTLYPVFEKMQEVKMVLSIHGESPKAGVFCLDRERRFLPTLFALAGQFPKLKIVLEHISTEEAVRSVESLDNVAGTITVHHLLLTLDDVVGGLISPHNFCKPIAKRPHDRAVLLMAATSGNPKFFFGSDSAPHLREKKECNHGCAGVFNAPVALSLLVQKFKDYSALGLLENFSSGFGADWYDLPRNTETIELVEKDWIVPDEYDGIIPFMAGQTLHFQIAE